MSHTDASGRSLPPKNIKDNIYESYVSKLVNLIGLADACYLLNMNLETLQDYLYTSPIEITLEQKAEFILARIDPAFYNKGKFAPNEGSPFTDTKEEQPQPKRMTHSLGFVLVRHNDNTLNNELQITVIKDDGEAFIFNISEGYFETIRRLIA